MFGTVLLGISVQWAILEKSPALLQIIVGLKVYPMNTYARWRVLQDNASLVRKGSTTQEYLVANHVSRDMCVSEGLILDILKI